MRLFIISILPLVFTSLNVIGQTGEGDYVQVNHFEPPVKEIKAYVKDSIRKWQKKGMFETTEEYKQRVNPKATQALKEQLKQKKVNEIVSDIVKLNITDNDYDADNGVFKLAFARMNPIYVKVPNKNKQAQQFYDNIDRIAFRNPQYAITKDDNIALVSAVLHNPANNKKYQYDSDDQVTFKDDNTAIAREEIEIGPVSREMSNQPVTVDTKIPETDAGQAKTYVLVIGNEDYTSYQPSLTREQNVDFATNDATTFASYCKLTLGIPESNIRVKENVTSGEMQRHIEWLTSRAKFGGDDVKLIFYYSGHGFPSQDNKEKYLMPVDISGSQVEEGIALGDLYNQLTSHSAQRVTVFLDACFSGAGREKGLLAAKSVKVKPKENTISKGNLVAFSSSRGDQKSFFYRDKKHGIFTYYLLKKLKQTKGQVTYGALHDYLTTKVPLKSTSLHSAEQVPAVQSSLELKQGEWREWGLR